MNVEEKSKIAMKIIISMFLSFKFTRKEIKLVLESVGESIPEEII